MALLLRKQTGRQQSENEAEVVSVLQPVDVLHVTTSPACPLRGRRDISRRRWTHRSAPKQLLISHPGDESVTIFAESDVFTSGSSLPADVTPDEA